MSKKEIKIQGIPGALGYALGRSVIYRKTVYVSEVIELASQEEIEKEKQKFFDAQKTVLSFLKELKNKMLSQNNKQAADIFDGHGTLLEDNDVESNVLQNIAENKKTASLSVEQYFEECAKVMEALDDEYLQERAADFRDIKNKLLTVLHGGILGTQENLEQNTIIVAKDLTPADIACMDNSKILGFVLEEGGTSSHIVIYANSLALPAVVGAKGIIRVIENGDIIAMDGKSGGVIVNPNEVTTQEHSHHIQKEKDHINALKTLRKKEAITCDGHKMELHVNIGNLKDLQSAIDNGCDGIGLFRTEFLYSGRTTAPSEEELFLLFKEAAEMLEGKPLVIRSLDIGGDKSLPYLSLGKEENPFLGYRGMRIYKEYDNIFKAQVRAILRAAVFGNIALMFPMVTSLQDLRWLNQYVRNIKNDLRSEKIPIRDSMKTGIMIETPASVFIADVLARETGFFSIGSNDLTQYILAVDRGNEHIASIYSSFYPSVLRAIYKVCTIASSASIDISLCGEFASDINALAILVGMGVSKVSVNGAHSLLLIKEKLLSLHYSKTKHLVKDILKAQSLEEVNVLVEQYDMNII